MESECDYCRMHPRISIESVCMNRCQLRVSAASEPRARSGGLKGRRKQACKGAGDEVPRVELEES
jgi:hypothetical protein